MRNKFNNEQNLKTHEKYFTLWGAVIVLLMISNAATAWFWWRDTENGSPKTLEHRYNLLDPARGVHRQEDLLINFQPLREELQKFEEDKNVSLYFEFLNTGANISVNKDGEFFAASLLKVPVAIAATKKVENNQWKWSNELVLMRTDKDEKFGSLYTRPIGTKLTIEQVVREMLVSSDNTAFKMLVRNLEPEELLNVHKHLGSDRLFSEDGKIGAKKYSAIFRALYNSSYLSDENSQKLLAWLSQSPFNEYLAAALPKDITFSHKIGIELERSVFLDSGIVYLENRPYLLTVMVSNYEEESAEKIMREISEQAFKYINEYSD